MVGKDQWVAGLSADHGVHADSRAARRRGQGRRPHQRRRDRRRDRAGVEAGARRGTATSIVLNTNDIYFEPGVYDKILKSRQLTDRRSSRRSQAQPGIQRVFRSEEIRGAASVEGSAHCARRRSATFPDAAAIWCSRPSRAG